MAHLVIISLDKASDRVCDNHHHHHRRGGDGSSSNQINSGPFSPIGSNVTFFHGEIYELSHNLIAWFLFQDPLFWLAPN